MSEIEREAFERWAKQEAMQNAWLHMKDLLKRDADGLYQTIWVDQAWIGWQARAQAAQPASGVPEGWQHCSCCGTHEVEIVQQCHNSDCKLYADEVSIYKGWEQNGGPSDE